MKYILTDKTYIIEEIFGTLEEAQEELKRWEAMDKIEGLYIKDNYMIFPKGWLTAQMTAKEKEMTASKYYESIKTKHTMYLRD